MSNNLNFNERIDRQIGYSVLILSEKLELPATAKNGQIFGDNYDNELKNIRENPPLSSRDMLIKEVECERNNAFQNAIMELIKVHLYDEFLEENNYYDHSTARKIGKSVNKKAEIFGKSREDVKNDFLNPFYTDAYYKIK